MHFRKSARFALMGATIIVGGFGINKASADQLVATGGGVFIVAGTSTNITFNWYAAPDGTQSVLFTKTADQSSYASATFVWTDAGHQTGQGTVVVSGTSHNVTVQWSPATGGGTLLFNEPVWFAKAELVF